jgi:hypothetical protein
MSGLSPEEQQSILAEEEAEAENGISPEDQSEEAEQKSWYRQAGSERIKRVGSFFSRMKDNFREKMSRTGSAVSMAAKRAKEAGIVGLETVMATPELIRRGIDVTADAGLNAYDATVEFGNRALYSAAEKVSKPFLEFQRRRLSHALEHMAKRVERKNMTQEHYDEAEGLLRHLNDLLAI